MRERRNRDGAAPDASSGIEPASGPERVVAPDRAGGACGIARPRVRRDNAKPGSRDVSIRRPHHVRGRGWTVVGLAAASLLSACATFRPTNVPLERWDPDYGYRPRTVNLRRPVGDVLLVLAFSGGGTRAAAFSYGVLQELRDTSVVVAGRRTRLLDEVDLVTSVSGGSFTSAYYALFGDRIFTDFERRFLRRNVQRRLLLELLRPYNWLRLVTVLDRTELAIRFYDREVFERATFADLLAAGGPFVQINATDLAAGTRFTFFQPQFDLICSDLSPFSVARAVAASAAVPALFSAVTLRNHAGTCGFTPPEWLRAAEADRRNRRRHRAAAMLRSYLDGERRYIHLVDGGVADNLGLRGPLDNVLLAGGLHERMEQIGNLRPSHVAIIVVNAEVHPRPGFSLSASAPSIATILNAVSGVQIYGYNFETLELLRESIANWALTLPPDAENRPASVYVPELAFESLEDAAERDFFNAVPTTFNLSDATVDRLIAVGRRLLREDRDFQRLVAALRGPASR
jgi:NTE family protein